MMKTKLMLILLLGALAAQAQTIEVSGLQSGTWQADTVKVVGNIKVQDSLCIAPGTTVLFGGFYQIAVENDSRLNAVGTETDSILFTIADTTGFHLFNSGRGGWNGIRLSKAGTSRFEYCRFQYGKAALDSDQDGGALRIFHSDAVEIGHSTLFCNFSREHGGALSAIESIVTIYDCEVSNNLTYTELDTVFGMYGGGMRFHKCIVDITGTDFLYNIGNSAIGGALSLDSCAVNIDRCRFEQNVGVNGGGLYLMRSKDYPCHITNSLFTNNTSNHFGGGLAICDASPSLSNLTVVNNHSIGVNCGGIFFYQYSSPYLRNCIVYGNTNNAPLEKPVQIWSWTFEDDGPQFINCLIQYGIENISGKETINLYEDNIDEDPLFVDAENGNFRLSEGSPCINSGSTYFEDFSAFDLDHNDRVKGNVIDMGAYEFSGAGIGETAQKEQNVRIVGNPITATSYAEIELDVACNLTASLYSIEGRLLSSKDLGKLQAGYHRIEMGEMFQSLRSGTYLFVIGNGQKTFANKVVKP